MKKLLPFLAVLLFLSLNIWAQGDKALLEKLVEEDRESIDALVMYPQDARRTILEASLHPELLVRMQHMQTNTSEQFKALVENYPRETQEAIWDLTRYPGLIDQLVNAGAGNFSQWNSIVADYPEKVQTTAKDAARNHFPLLKEMVRLDKDAQNTFEQLLLRYEPATRQTFRELIQMPEVISILTENMELTVLMGDVYQQDPDWVMHKTDSLSLAVAQDNARELEDWKKELAANPDAVKELEASTEEYSKEYNFDDYYYEAPYYDDDDNETVIVRNYYYNQYPYWYGYPYWEPIPRWRPYPYWYDWGFYYSPSHTIIIVGLPSYNYTWWYFNRHQHHYYYPHLSNHFVNHYYGHRHTSSGVVVSVDHWKRNNRDVVKDDWLADRNQRVERLREYGKMEMDRDKFNQQNPRNQQTSKEFLDSKPKAYPEVHKAVAIQNPDVRTKEQPKVDRPPVTREPVIKPKAKEEIRKPDVREPVTKPKAKEEIKKPDVRQPEVKPKTQPKVEPRRPVRKPDVKAPQPRQEREKAADYHKQSWEKSKPQPQPKVAPQPRTNPQPKVTPSKPKVAPSKKPTPKARPKLEQ